MLDVAGGEGGEHEGIVELALGKGGQLREARLVTQFEARAGVGVGREAFGALQYLRAARAEGRQGILAQAREGEVGLVGGVEQLPELVVGGVVGVGAGHHVAQVGVVEHRLAVVAHHVVHLLCGLHGAEDGRADKRTLAHDGPVFAEQREQAGTGAELLVTLQRDAYLLGVEGCPVVERHAVSIVGCEYATRRIGEFVIFEDVLVLVFIVLALGGEAAHEQSGEVDVGLGERPEEG